MLLSCFALIHSAAVDVMPERYGTPPRQVQASGIQILKYSPGTAEEKRKKDVRNLSFSPPETPCFGVSKSRGAASSLGSFSPHPNCSAAAVQASQHYFVYICLGNSGSSYHMTLRKTIVDQAKLDQLLEIGKIKLSVLQPNSRAFASIPCKIGFNLYRDAETGLMSPSRSILRAFNNSPAAIRQWVEDAEKLNQSRAVSELLSCLPDTGDLGHHPLGHTEQSFCSRGAEYPAIYTQCYIEIAKITDSKMQSVLETNMIKMSKLDNFIITINSYLAEDARTLLADLPEIFHGKTVAETLSMLKEISSTGNQLAQNRKRITLQFSQKWTCAKKALALIKEDYSKIYQKILTDNSLRPLFIAAGPNVAVCHKIASLALTALRRDMGQFYLSN